MGATSRRALAAGMQAYLTKDVLHDELLKAIRAVHAGETYLPAAVAAPLAAQCRVPGARARSRCVPQPIVRIGQQANRLHTEHCGAHGEEPRQEHPEWGGVCKTDASRHAAIQRGIIPVNAAPPVYGSKGLGAIFNGAFRYH
jgi:hypothetical protein